MSVFGIIFTVTIVSLIIGSVIFDHGMSIACKVAALVSLLLLVCGLHFQYFFESSNPSYHAIAHRFGSIGAFLGTLGLILSAIVSYQNSHNQ